MLAVVRLTWLLFFGMGSGAGTAQPGQPAPPLHTYRGQVVDTDRRPLAGASVLVKGTHTAVTTNADGAFMLSLPAGTYKLLVDYPGHLAPEAPLVSPDSVLTIVLRSTQPRPARR